MFYLEVKWVFELLLLLLVLASAIPFIGEYIVIWLWGGYSVDNATLNRFFSLHYLLPFVIASISFITCSVLHESGSSNPLKYSC